jgi:hypothetical protein
MCQERSSSSVLVRGSGLRTAAILLASLFKLFPGTAYAVSPVCGNNPVEIVGPVYEGTRVIAYDYAADLCHIFVFANGTSLINLVGEALAEDVPYGEIELYRPLKDGEVIVATTGGINGPQSKSVTVEKIRSALLVNGEQFPTPSIPPMVECQKSFAVQGLLRGGVRVPYKVSGSYTETGAVWSPYDSTPVVLSRGLAENDKVVAMQDIDKSFPKPSEGASQTVKKRDYPIPRPRIADFVFGAKALLIYDAHGGADIVLYEHDENGNLKERSRGVVTGSGIGRATWKMGTLLTNPGGYCVAQFLCDEASPQPMHCVVPKMRPRKPVIQKPICPDEHKVVINDTDLALDLQLRVERVDGSVEDYFVATRSEASVVLLPQNKALKAGDKITALQGNLLLDSEWSDAVTVEQSNEPCLLAQRPFPLPGPPPKHGNIARTNGGPGQRPSPGPAPSSGCKFIHVSEPVPSGWIMTDCKWDPTQKDSHLDYNLKWICRYDHLPIGTEMDVCGQAPTPPGWQVVGQKWDPNRCAGKPTAKPNNIKRIKRYQ